MRYPAKKWRIVAILMRDSTYSVLEALNEGPKGWTDLREAADLTDGGLQKVLQELIRIRLVEETFVVKPTGFKEKKYTLTGPAKKSQIYEKAKDLKESLEKIATR
jgi:DNA-binding HxlR family transcriptional regulator